MEPKITSFTQLIAWQKAHKLVLTVYKITKTYPAEEKYALVDQLRRAAVSITSNIAEGFARRTALNKNQFYYDALASLAEVASQIILSRDLRYLSQEMFERLEEQLTEVQKLVNGLIKSSATK